MKSCSLSILQTGSRQARVGGIRAGLLAVVLAGAVILFGAGCAHGGDGAAAAPKGPPITTEVEVTGLKQEEREVLQEAVCTLPHVSSCELTVTVLASRSSKKDKRNKKKRRGKKKRKAKKSAASSKTERTHLRFTYEGTLPELRAGLAGLPHPGLEVQTAMVKLTYKGFDNIPPEITITAPEAGSVHTVSEIEVLLAIPAVDVAQVIVGNEIARRVEPGVYRAKLKLPDGDQVLLIKATDKAANMGQIELPLLVDTTPPTLEVKILVQAGDRVVISGQVEGAATVTIDGVEVPIRSFGKFSKNLPADPDKKDAEIIAVDEHGNSSSLKPKLEAGWSGSAGPGAPAS